MDFFGAAFAKTLADFFPKQPETPTRRIKVGYYRENDGRRHSADLPFEYTSETNLIAALSILRELEGDDFVYMMRDACLYDDVYINTSFTAEVVQG
jgi:hypothetical protein